MYSVLPGENNTHNLYKGEENKIKPAERRHDNILTQLEQLSQDNKVN